MADRDVYDLLADRLTRLAAAQAETNSKLAEVVDTLKQMASVQLALRVGQDHLVERVDVLADRIDRVADRVDRLSDAVIQRAAQAS